MEMMECMMTIECLLILSMRVIVSFIGLWKADFNELSNVLLLLCFIIVLTLNCPGYKSFSVYRYFRMLNDQPAFKYVLEEDDSIQILNKMYCILLSSATNTLEEDENEETDALIKKEDSTLKSLAVFGQPRIMQQYNFSNWDIREKRSFIDRHVQYGNEWTLRAKTMRVVYLISSLIAFMSPIAWIIWYSIHFE